MNTGGKIVIGTLVLVAATTGGKYLYDRKNTKKSGLQLDEVNANYDTCSFGGVDGARQKANQLHIAMRGFGTKEKVVLQILSECQNANDLACLIHAFGMKKYRGSFAKLNLTGWLNYETSFKTKKQIAQVYSNFNMPF